MDTQGPAALKASPDQMVCSRQPWTSHTWPPFLIKTENYPGELHGQTYQDIDPPTSPKKPTTEFIKVRSNLTSPLNSSKDLFKTYPNQFEGIGQFPGTCDITLHDDAKPVIHVPRKCPIAMQPLVCKKSGEFINQGIIIPVEDPTDWVSSLAYSWKANGKL